MTIGRRAFFGRGLGATIASIVGGKTFANEVETMAASLSDAPVGNVLEEASCEAYVPSPAKKALEFLSRQKEYEDIIRHHFRNSPNDPDIDALTSCSAVYRRSLMQKRIEDEVMERFSIAERLWYSDEKL